jgi:hypothetical protein
LKICAHLRPIPRNTLAELRRDMERRRLVSDQIRQIEEARLEAPTHHRQQPKGSWLEQMLARKPRMLVTVALANKMARIIWALLVKQENYRAPVAAKALAWRG